MRAALALLADASIKLRGKERHFIDRARVKLHGGKGGDGCAAFLREAFRPKGPPAGGNGGAGGSVIVVATPEMTTLRGITATYVAKHGAPGQGRMMHGKRGDDLIVKVPLGTVLREVPPASDDYISGFDDHAHDAQPTLSLSADRDGGHQENNDSGNIIARLKRKYADQLVKDDTMTPRQLRRAQKHLETPLDARQGRHPSEPLQLDLMEPGVQYVLAKGGRGGLGNIAFSSTHHGSRHRTLGEPGEQRTFQLELKTIAQLGLVGLPNAGKSTLLTAVSNATPEVADYPFTTLNPYLGTITYPDATRLTMADIPGLIAGAHRNVGLGHDFLRHVERSEVLVYVVDVSRDDPTQDLETLLTELELYRRGMTRRPAIVVANKADVVPQAKVGLQKLSDWVNSRQFVQFWSPAWEPASAESAAPPTDTTPFRTKYTDVPDDHLSWKVVPVSAKHRANISALLVELRLMVEKKKVLQIK
ncbi:GTPase of the mitochondrial inner membrane that associates with the large ribosomal subunit [Sorochytrium milnesiophthora]